jgi:hypothetical protein
VGVSWACTCEWRERGAGATPAAHHATTRQGEEHHAQLQELGNLHHRVHVDVARGACVPTPANSAGRGAQQKRQAVGWLRENSQQPTLGHRHSVRKLKHRGVGKRVQ